jgi:hypothetical protein
VEGTGIYKMVISEDFLVDEYGVLYQKEKGHDLSIVGPIDLRPIFL